MRQGQRLRSAEARRHRARAPGGRRQRDQSRPRARRGALRHPPPARALRGHEDYQVDPQDRSFTITGASPGRHRGCTGRSPGPSPGPSPGRHRENRPRHRAPHRYLTHPVTGAKNSESGRKPGPSPGPSPGNGKFRGTDLPPHRTLSRTLCRGRHRGLKKSTGTLAHPGLTGPCLGACPGAVTGPSPGVGNFGEIRHVHTKWFFKGTLFGSRGSRTASPSANFSSKPPTSNVIVTPPGRGQLDDLFGTDPAVRPATRTVSTLTNSAGERTARRADAVQSSELKKKLQNLEPFPRPLEEQLDDLFGTDPSRSPGGIATTLPGRCAEQRRAGKRSRASSQRATTRGFSASPADGWKTTLRRMLRRRCCTYEIHVLPERLSEESWRHWQEVADHNKKRLREMQNSRGCEAAMLAARYREDSADGFERQRPVALELFGWFGEVHGRERHRCDGGETV